MERFIKQAVELDGNAIRLLLLGSIGTSALANVLIANRLKSHLDSVKPSKVHEENLAKALGLPKDFVIRKHEGYGNAAAFSKGAVKDLIGEMDRILKRKNQDKESTDYKFSNAFSDADRKSALDLGMIMYDPKFAKPGILAHEAGHINIGHRKWYNPSRFNQSVLRRLDPITSGAGLIGSMVGGGVLGDAISETDWNPITKILAGAGGGVLLGTAGGLLGGAPTLINEHQATAFANRHLDKMRITDESKKANREALSKAFHTYLGGSVIPSAIMGGLVGGITAT